MARFDPTGRPSGERQARPTWYSAKQIMPSLFLGNDDAAAFNTVVNTVSALGAGGIVIDGLMKLGSDVSVPRNVALAGVAPIFSQVKSTNTTMRRFKITGIPSTAPNFAGDIYTVSFLTFDTVSLDFAPNTAIDESRGCRAFQCEFVNCDRGLSFDGNNASAFAGVGAMQCKFRVCGDGILFNNGGPAHFVQECDISECEHAAIHVAGTVLDGLSLFVHCGYSDHCARFIKTSGTFSGDGNIYVNGWGIELCGTSDAGQLYPSGTTYGGGQYADGGYGIENTGAQIWLDNINFFQGTHTDALFWCKGGIIYVGSGRYFWNLNAFCRMNGGYLCVDQSKMFSPSKLWGGQGVTGQFHHASSTAGEVFGPRVSYVGRTGYDFSNVNNTTQSKQMLFGLPYDWNNREFNATIVSLADGTTNTLRVQIADGGTSPLIDCAFPLVPGNGHLRVVCGANQITTVEVTYFPNALGSVATVSNPPTQAEVNAIVTRVNLQKRMMWVGTFSASPATATRYLQIQTLTGGGTASTINVFSLREEILGIDNTLGI